MNSTAWNIFDRKSGESAISFATSDKQPAGSYVFAVKGFGI